MALGSTQPLVKMSTRDVAGGKGGRCVKLTTYHHIVPMSRNLGALTLLELSGPAWPVMGVLYLYLYIYVYIYIYIRVYRCRNAIPTYTVWSVQTVDAAQGNGVSLLC
jgi:hypothetical protein